MVKLNIKNLGVAVFLGLFLVGIIGFANAQQTLPKGGDSFETAVKIEPGNYQGASLKEAEYFYITGVKPGKEINIKGTFTAADVDIGAWAILALYDEEGTELAIEEDGLYDEPLSLTISQLHTGKDSDKYYIKTESDIWEIGSYTLEISLEGEEEEVALPAGEEEEAAKESLNWLWILLGVIVAIIVIVIVAYFLLKKKK